MRLFGLIGRQLGHSYSQIYFEKKFERLGLDDCKYALYEIPEIHFIRKLIDDQVDLCGLNVTIPFKKDIIPLLDQMDEIALAIGAVNTIKIIRNDGKIILKGYNTDVIGFEKCLRPLLRGGIERALVFGTGGASASVIYVLKKLGISPLLVSRLDGDGDLTYVQLNDDLIAAHHLLINTTPVGQHPHVSEVLPIPLHAVGPDHICIDLVYNPEETLFLKQCKAKGAWTESGLSMLYAQADASWNIWNNPSE